MADNFESWQLLAVFVGLGGRKGGDRVNGSEIIKPLAIVENARAFG